MEQQREEKQLRMIAEKRVEAKLGFRNHLIIYAAVNTLLFLIWLFTSLFAAEGWLFPWFVFPLVGWGIAIVIHAVSVYGPTSSAERFEARVQRELEKMEGAPHGNREA